MKFKMLIASALLTACAHETPKLEVVADVRLGETYQLANEPRVKECTVVPANLITTIAAGDQLLSTESVGTEGLVCGVVDCSKQEGDVVFTCTTFEMIKGQPARTPKAN